MHYPRCKFKGGCVLRKNDNCTALDDMPKPKKDGSCPFQKERLNDIAGREKPSAEKVIRKEGIWKTH